jgi:hypothetical protein
MRLSGTALALVLAVLGAATQVAAVEREARRVAGFTRVHSHTPGGVVSGMIGNARIELVVSNYRVTGMGGAGWVDVVLRGNVLSGRAGNASVMLQAGGNTVTGSGARGFARLAWWGNTAGGTIGGMTVNVVGGNGWLEGTIGLERFSIYVGPAANPTAALLMVALI